MIAHGVMHAGVYSRHHRRDRLGRHGDRPARHTHHAHHGHDGHPRNVALLVWRWPLCKQVDTAGMVVVLLGPFSVKHGLCCGRLGIQLVAECPVGLRPATPRYIEFALLTR